MLYCCRRVLVRYLLQTGARNSAWHTAAARGYNKSALKFISSFQQLQGCSVHAPGHFCVIRNIRKLNGRETFISAERAQNLGKGENGLSSMSNTCSSCSLSKKRGNTDLYFWTWTFSFLTYSLFFSFFIFLSVMQKELKPEELNLLWCPLLFSFSDHFGQWYR